MSRWLGRLTRIRLDYPGLVVAIWFFCLSLTPSLLPRPWYLQGVISGIVTATGYAVGRATSWTVRHVVRWLGLDRRFAPRTGQHCKQNPGTPRVRGPGTGTVVRRRPCGR